MNERAGSPKSADAYRTIGEVADELKLPQHVLRFWETRFPQVKPLKRAGGRRFYRPDDVALLRAIKAMLYGQGYTIKGVQRLLQEQGSRTLAASAASAIPPNPAEAPSPGADRTGPRDRDPPPVPSPGVAPSTRRGVPPSPPAGPPASPSLAGVRARLESVARDLAECSRMLDAARAVDDRQ